MKSIVLCKQGRQKKVDEKSVEYACITSRHSVTYSPEREGPGEFKIESVAAKE